MNKAISLVSLALETLEIEAKAITQLKDSINADFESVVNFIYESQARVVITGIGKSALIGQKIVATLNSTGTPAVFLHAADAIHGDLGMIQSNDLVICLSKSGNSPEIKALIPFLKKGTNKLVGMTANKTSQLAKQADFLLHTPVEKEACPHNLAPTTSTTVQLVLGDAIAVCLMQKKNFQTKDFAKYHPGGSLGKQLYLQLTDLLDPDEQPYVALQTPINKVINEITSKRKGATVVLDQNAVVGLITDGDIRRMLETYDNPFQKAALDIMTADPFVLQEDSLASYALLEMDKRKLNHIIVVSNTGTYLGIIHVLDFVKEGLR